MGKSLKAALLSVLVLPGAGHFYLNKPVTGVLLSGTTLVCLWFIIRTAMAIAQQLVTTIQSGEVPLDIPQISQLVSEQLAGAAAQGITVPSLVLALCWVVGAIDAFRIGWLLDQQRVTSKKNRPS